MTFHIQNGVLFGVTDCDAHVTIPDYITEIGDLAFFGCTALQSVSIPDSVTAISDDAFEDCTRLQSVSIPDSVAHIGDYAFYNCPALRSVIISENHPHFTLQNGMMISKRGTLHFALPDIVHADIPDSVTEIRLSAFENCFRLESVSFPASLTRIGIEAFLNCVSLQSLRLFPKHFHLTCFDPFDEQEGLALVASLDKVPVIICASPLCEIPEEYKLKACLGFALREEEYPSELHSEYLEYIRTHAEELCTAALRLHELVRLMCRERLIDAEHFDSLMNETIRRENVELTASLLEYKRNQLSSAENAFTDDLSLD